MTAFNRAADVVLAIAAIPSLREGAVAFDPPDLEGGYWFCDPERAMHLDPSQIVVTIPEELDRDSIDAAIREGIEEARAVMQDCLDAADNPVDREAFAARLRELDALGASEPVGALR
jgi:hypothetical protein